MISPKTDILTLGNQTQIQSGLTDKNRPVLHFPPLLSSTALWRGYAAAFLVVVVCTLIAALMFPYFAPANLCMVYLAGVVVTALFYGRGPSIMATVLSAGAFDFFFVQPYDTFAISDVQYVLTLVVMLLVAVTISSLAVRSREQTAAARERERHTVSLYIMNHKLAGARNIQQLVELAVQHIARELEGQVAMLLPDPDAVLQVKAESAPNLNVDLDAAQWAYQNKQVASQGTATWADSRGLYIPLLTTERSVGVLALFAVAQSAVSSDNQVQFLRQFADQIASSIERLRLTEEAQFARMEAETERLRNTLLSSVSHDLRTPLASITGATSTLFEKGLALDPQTHDELAQLAYEEAQRLNRLVGNLLDMTRLESGGLKLEKEWQTLEEVVGTSLRRLGKRRNTHPFHAHLPPELPLIPMDSLLIEQVLVNLIENAIKYTPPGTPIDLTASLGEHEVIVEVADKGPGIPPGSEARIFDKFFRAAPSQASGVGLGLTICKGIVEAHGGRIWAENRGGAVFRFTLPLEGEPEVALENDREDGNNG